MKKSTVLIALCIMNSLFAMEEEWRLAIMDPLDILDCQIQNLKNEMGSYLDKIEKLQTNEEANKPKLSFYRGLYQITKNRARELRKQLKDISKQKEEMHG